MKTLGKIAQIVLGLMLIVVLFFGSMELIKKPEVNDPPSVVKDVQTVVDEPQILWEPILGESEGLEVVQDSKVVPKKTWREKASAWWNKEKPPKPPKKSFSKKVGEWAGESVKDAATGFIDGAKKK